MGNLGWNTDEKTIEERALAVLTEAGVDASWYSGLNATRKEGSLAELCFNSAEQLQRARLLVRSLRKTFSDDRVVWLDVKKSREEMRPARIVHRMAECVTDFEASQSSPLAVDKQLNGKYIKVGTDRIGQVIRGEWKWFPFAKGRYSSELLEFAKGFAEEQ